MWRQCHVPRKNACAAEKPLEATTTALLNWLPLAWCTTSASPLNWPKTYRSSLAKPLICSKRQKTLTEAMPSGWTGWHPRHRSTQLSPTSAASHVFLFPMPILKKSPNSIMSVSMTSSWQSLGKVWSAISRMKDSVLKKHCWRPYL